MHSVRAERALVFPSGKRIEAGTVWRVTSRVLAELTKMFGDKISVIEPDGRSQRDRFLRARNSVVK